MEGNYLLWCWWRGNIHCGGGSEKIEMSKRGNIYCGGAGGGEIFNVVVKQWKCGGCGGGGGGGEIIIVVVVVVVVK